MLEAGADCEQAYATKRPRFGLNALTDFSLNHGRAQGSFRAIVGGLHIMIIQERPQRLLTLEHLAAFHWQQLWPNSWMAWLATPLAATAFARDAHFAALAVAGGWFGRVTRIAAGALPQAGQLGSQGGELAAELTFSCLRT